MKSLPGAEKLELVVADLLDAGAWPPACSGCSAVLHVASVFKVGLSEADVVTPAVEGTKNVLTAAADAGIRRVIVTSSIAAMYGGHPAITPFSENDWTDPHSERCLSSLQTHLITRSRSCWPSVRLGKLLKLETWTSLLSILATSLGRYLIQVMETANRQSCYGNCWSGKCR